MYLLVQILRIIAISFLTLVAAIFWTETFYKALCFLEYGCNDSKIKVWTIVLFWFIITAILLKLNATYSHSDKERD